MKDQYYETNTDIDIQLIFVVEYIFLCLTHQYWG